MPYAKRYYTQDPLYPAKNRGEGYYYGRGHGYLAKWHKKHNYQENPQQYVQVQQDTSLSRRILKKFLK